jgi:hypothetical protein
MNLLHISSAVVWVDFITIVLHRFFNLGKSLNTWYAEFGIVAIISDCLVIVLGILLAQILFPKFPLLWTAIAIQIIHDVLFYLFVILPIPLGQNKIIDLFKDYATENGWKILAVDSLMIGSTVLIAQQLSTMKNTVVSFLGLLGAYLLTYIIYTK